VRYRLDPREQLRIFLELEEVGWDLLAIYHSHPGGPSTPSPTDIAEAAYPEAVYLIWSPDSGGWNCRGFLIQEGQVREVQVIRSDGGLIGSPDN
jgi:proteasome lid subunit RPN8/RPN11